MTASDHPTVLERWSFRTGTDCTILPDGCRDLIFTTMPDGRRVGQLSPLTDGTRTVTVAGGRRLAAQPGALGSEDRSAPVHWMQLARVRRAARALGDAAPIADTADAHGYADRARFTRECRRWLGTTPARLRDGRDAGSRTTLALLHEPGYGASSTAVQSSTR